LKPTSSIRYSKKLLFTTFNCAKAQLIPLQEAYEIQDDALIMALTGLAGGILNNGSTCGVVIGGAISSAMIRDQALAGKWTLADEIQLLEEVGRDVAWFEERFGTCLCRERDDLNYQRITVIGLLNPRKVKGCVARTGASMTRFMAKQPMDEARAKADMTTGAGCRCTHCASGVLEEIRLQTGIGHERLEQIAVALDGGIGLSGGGCGALSGALMALGLRFALDPKKTDPRQLRNIYRSMDSEFFRKAKILVSRFIKTFGYLECSRLTGNHFQDWDDFCAFRKTSACDALHRFVVEETVNIMQMPV